MSMIALDLGAFRGAFAQFADPVAFPDAAITVQWGIATGYVSDSTYGRMAVAARTSALQLMTAHLLALGVILAADNYEQNPAVVTAATVGGVSVTLAPPPARSQWQWWLNVTPYGAQLAALLEAQSVGGFYVGGLPERAAYRKVGGTFS